MSDEGAGRRARDEAAGAAAYFIVAGLGVIALEVAQRWAAQPDSLRTVRMAVWREAEHGLAQLAAWCWKGAEHARRSYEADAA